MPGETVSRTLRLRAALGALLERARTAVVGAEDRTGPAHAHSEMLWDGAVEHFGGALALFDRERRAVRLNGNLVKWLRFTGEDAVGRRCDELFPRVCATSRARMPSRRPRNAG